ncbi:MAG: hypothetical protein ACRCXC_07645 [Legionella sp.]
MKIDSLNHYLAEQRREEELMRQRRLGYLLMASMTKNKAQALNVADVIRQQIEKRLKDTKTTEENKSAKSIALEIVEANIRADTNAIQDLNDELEELNNEIENIDHTLAALDHEEELMLENHAHLDDHLQQLSALLQLPFLVQPFNPAQHVTHANQQVAALTTQIAALKAQPDAQTGVQTTESPALRKIRLLEEQLAFHRAQVQQQQQPQSTEQILAQLFTRISDQINQRQRLQLAAPREIHLD